MVLPDSEVIRLENHGAHDIFIVYKKIWLQILENKKMKAVVYRGSGKLALGKA